MPFPVGKAFGKLPESLNSGDCCIDTAFRMSEDFNSEDWAVEAGRGPKAGLLLVGCGCGSSEAPGTLIAPSGTWVSGK